MYLVTANEMQQMDRKTIKSFGLSGRVLMENAGRKAVGIFLKTFGGLLGQKVGVVAGRGNNGGDGFVIARCLAQKGISVTVFLLSRPSLLKGDAARNFKLLAPLSIPVYELPDRDAFLKRKTVWRNQDVWIDAIFGTGLNSNVKGYYKQVIDTINRSNCPVFSVDIPSGLNADTGQPWGACVRAHTTATFAFAKTGHLLYPGATYTGKLEIVDIGIPPHIIEEVQPLQHLLTPEYVSGCLKTRPPDAHKGNTGHLLVIAASPGKTGAAALTAMSAMRSGAGLVTLGIPRSLNPILEGQVLEAMTCPLPETPGGMLAASALDPIMNLLAGKKCLAIGPGLGLAEDIKKLVHRIVMECRLPVVIDADGLNSLAGKTKLLKKAKCPLVLTPHPGEMARLMNTTVSQVQKDRITCSREFARTYNVHIILKGARTVIAHPDGMVYVNPTGNPGMASGGMGDVLTGIVAGLIVQGYSPRISAHVATYLHGATADAQVTARGPIGYVASDVMNDLPRQIGKLIGPNPIFSRD